MNLRSLFPSKSSKFSFSFSCYLIFNNPIYF